MSEINDNWYITENWSNENLSYHEGKNVLYFNTNSREEEAVITISVPNGAKSFSFSFKIGNGYITHKVGNQDSGYAIIGFGNDEKRDNVEKSSGIRTNSVFNKRNFINLSVGTEAKSIGIIGEPDYFYFIIHASNAGDDEMDVYFGDFELTFYDEEGYIPMSEYISFKESETNETIFIGEHMTWPVIVGALYLICFLAVSLKIFMQKKDKEEEEI